MISVDAELAWGFHDRFPLSEPKKRRFVRARDAWRRLVELFDEYEIPATWAIVGHLVEPEFDVESVYQELPPGLEMFRKYGQYEQNIWLGEELIQGVLDARVSHDIGSHSFSHPLFDLIPPEIADTELRLSRKLSDWYGDEPTSFIFPRNIVSKRKNLKQNGFYCYRGHRPEEHVRSETLDSLRFLTGYATGALPPPVVSPTVDEYGLVNVPASLYLGGRKALPWSVLRRFRGDPVVSMARSGIDCIRRQDGVFHVYVHPHDLQQEADFNRMESVLSYASTREARGEITVETMADVARRIGARQSSGGADQA